MGMLNPEANRNTLCNDDIIDPRLIHSKKEKNTDLVDKLYTTPLFDE